MSSVESEVSITEAVFLDNAASGGGAIPSNGTSPFWPVQMTVDASTFCGNNGTLGSGLRAFRSVITLEHSILAFGVDGPAFYCAASGSGTFSCSDLYGNEGGDWGGCIADQYGVNGNFSADPFFCNADAGDFTLRSDSPCLPGQHPDGYDCGLIGAFGEGCAGPTAVERMIWGGVKAMFR